MATGRPWVCNRDHSVLVATQTLKISGRFFGNQAPDSVFITSWPEIITPDDRAFTVQQRFIGKVVHGHFDVRLAHVPSNSFLSLGYAHDRTGHLIETVSMLQVQAGDSLAFEFTQKAARSMALVRAEPEWMISNIKGRGEAKYQCQLRLASRRPLIEANIAMETQKEYPDNSINSIKESLQKNEYILQHRTGMELAILDSFQHKLSISWFVQLRTELIARNVNECLRSLNGSLPSHLAGKYSDNADMGILARIFIDSVGHLFANTPIQAKLLSPDFAQLLVRKSILKSKITDTAFIASRVQDLIISDLSDNMRAKTLLAFLLDYGHIVPGTELTHFLQEDKRLIGESSYSTELDRYKSRTRANVAVENFSLPDSTGEQVRLSDFRNKVVFIDFWFVGCHGCSQYYQTVVSKVEDQFRKDTNVAFLTISINSDRNQWMSAVYSGRYTSPTIRNLYSPALGSDLPLIKNLYIESYPHPLLVGKDGRLFSNSIDELRGGGVAGLTAIINDALKANAQP
jgi:thiol-disulfide isomerase/thioredoxin